jgi:hypothetical protein
MINQGIDMENCKMTTPYDWGIVEKKGKHYLLCSEGVGNGKALESNKAEIQWYKHTFDSDGKLIAFDIRPHASTKFYFGDFSGEGAITPEHITLDKFIRHFGDRLDSNYIIWDRFLSGKSNRV